MVDIHAHVRVGVDETYAAAADIVGAERLSPRPIARPLLDICTDLCAPAAHVDALFASLANEAVEHARAHRRFGAVDVVPLAEALRISTTQHGPRGASEKCYRKYASSRKMHKIDLPARGEDNRGSARTGMPKARQRRGV